MSSSNNRDSNKGDGTEARMHAGRLPEIQRFFGEDDTAINYQSHAACLPLHSLKGKISESNTAGTLVKVKSVPKLIHFYVIFYRAVLSRKIHSQ